MDGRITHACTLPSDHNIIGDTKMTNIEDSIKTTLESNLKDLLEMYKLEVEIDSGQDYTVEYTNSIETTTENLPYQWYHYVFFPIGLLKMYDDLMRTLFANKSSLQEQVYHPPKFRINIKPKNYHLKNNISGFAAEIYDYNFTIISHKIEERKFKMNNTLKTETKITHVPNIKKLNKHIEFTSSRFRSTISKELGFEKTP